MGAWQFCERALFGMVSFRDPFKGDVGDLQIGDKVWSRLESPGDGFFHEHFSGKPLRLEGFLDILRPSRFSGGGST